MPKTTKTPRARKNTHKDTITVKPSSYRPTKEELEEEYSFEKDTGLKLEMFGDTLDEQIGNRVKWTFRQVNIKREG